MNLYTYEPHEISFAFCYRVYFSWRTHRRHAFSPLAKLQRATLNALLHPYKIRVLECVTNDTEVRCIVSLTPLETISGCASKLKGRVSKWLSEALNLAALQPLLCKGYFACTTGKSRSRVVERYLSLQSEHHGYSNRLLPPIFVDQYVLTTDDERRISPHHAMVIAKFHLVFSTTWRRGIIGSTHGRRISKAWLNIQPELRIALIKVSFVPDHVHVALRSHPSVSPASIAAGLMNSAQQVMQVEMIEAGVNRLWMNSAYVGSYGDLSSPQICKFLERWRSSE
ncbi:MAG TPA: IS200/IS605 family transposase [Pyrinomonadaceae bacterium]